jgi:ELWxxDGT repeat protein
MGPSIQSVVRRPRTAFLVCVITLLILLTIVSAPVHAGGAAFLVEDIQPGPVQVAPLVPEEFVTYGDHLYFTALTEEAGYELWKSDGTAAGTVLVKDIWPGVYLSYPADFVVFKGKLFFSAEDGSHGREWWMSDGTEAGTRLLKDINPGVDSSVSELREDLPSMIAVSGDYLFFVAAGSGRNYSLWRTDGTAEGTIALNDVMGAPYYLTDVNGTLFCNAHDSEHGYELWKSDGTPEGTKLVKDMYPGNEGADPGFLTNFKGTLYFNTGLGPYSTLWKSDGTEEGTAPVVPTAPFESKFGAVADFSVVGETLLFTAADKNGRELWKTDGTAAGTMIVKDIRAGAEDAFVWPSYNTKSPRTVVGETLFFVADDGIHGAELWKSDGTDAGTTLVKDILPGSADTFFASMTTSGADAYFIINLGSRSELWRSGGTPESTMRVKSFSSPPSAPSTSLSRYYENERLMSLNDTLFFSANDGDIGHELWKSDGTPDGTIPVQGMYIKYNNSHPRQLTKVNSTLFFSASSNFTDTKLWKSDGAESGATFVKELDTISWNGEMFWLMQRGSSLSFWVIDTTGELELWRSDGTSDRTTKVMDVSPGSAIRSLLGFANMGEKIMFSFSTSTDSNQLWVSDGTEAGTRLINNTGAFRMMVVKGTVFFLSREESGFQLWKSDGTPEGTIVVKTFPSNRLQQLDVSPPNPVMVSADIASMAVSDNTFLFVFNDGIHGNELWRSDGTAEGTVLLKDIVPGPTGSSPTGFANLNGTLFFIAETSTGRELWKSDGTSEGTAPVKDIYPGPGSSAPSELTVVDQTLFFSATGLEGRELWKSNGTAEGTTLVKDISAGSAGAVPTHFVDVDGKLVFNACSQSHGCELWRSDGTAAGTVLVQDIAAGRVNASPAGFTLIDETVFFSADDGVHGRELWAIPRAALATQSIPDEGTPTSTPTPDAGTPTPTPDARTPMPAPVDEAAVYLPLLER